MVRTFNEVNLEDDIKQSPVDEPNLLDDLSSFKLGLILLLDTRHKCHSYGHLNCLLSDIKLCALIREVLSMLLGDNVCMRSTVTLNDLFLLNFFRS